MRSCVSRIYTGIAVTGIMILLLAIVAYMVGARINTTKSIPVGLYWTTNDPVALGAYVMFCPPNSAVFAIARSRGYITGGFCPGSYGYLMKKVLAAKGDVIRVSDSGISVNGVQLPYSKPRETDLAGRELPVYAFDQYTLGSSELLLMSDVSETSFDARYFGPIAQSQVKQVIRPVVTW